MSTPKPLPQRRREEQEDPRYYSLQQSHPPDHPANPLNRQAAAASSIVSLRSLTSRFFNSAPGRHRATNPSVDLAGSVPPATRYILPPTSSGSPLLGSLSPSAVNNPLQSNQEFGDYRFQRQLDQKLQQKQHPQPQHQQQQHQQPQPLQYQPHQTIRPPPLSTLSRLHPHPTHGSSYNPTIQSMQPSLGPRITRLPSVIQSDSIKNVSPDSNESVLLISNVARSTSQADTSSQPSHLSGIIRSPTQANSHLFTPSLAPKARPATAAGRLPQLVLKPLSSPNPHVPPHLSRLFEPSASHRSPIPSPFKTSAPTPPARPSAPGEQPWMINLKHPPASSAHPVHPVFRPLTQAALVSPHAVQSDLADIRGDKATKSPPVSTPQQSSDDSSLTQPNGPPPQVLLPALPPPSPTHPTPPEPPESQRPQEIIPRSMAISPTSSSSIDNSARLNQSTRTGSQSSLSHASNSLASSLSRLPASLAAPAPPPPMPLPLLPTSTSPVQNSLSPSPSPSAPQATSSQTLLPALGSLARSNSRSDHEIQPAQLANAVHIFLGLRHPVGGVDHPTAVPPSQVAVDSLSHPAPATTLESLFQNLDLCNPPLSPPASSLPSLDSKDNLGPQLSELSPHASSSPDGVRPPQDPSPATPVNQAVVQDDSSTAVRIVRDQTQRTPVNFDIENQAIKTISAPAGFFASEVTQSQLVSLSALDILPSTRTESPSSRRGNQEFLRSRPQVDSPTDPTAPGGHSPPSTSNPYFPASVKTPPPSRLPIPQHRKMTDQALLRSSSTYRFKTRKISHPTLSANTETEWGNVDESTEEVLSEISTRRPSQASQISLVDDRFDTPEPSPDWADSNHGTTPSSSRFSSESPRTALSSSSAGVISSRARPLRSLAGRNWQRGGATSPAHQLSVVTDQRQHSDYTQSRSGVSSPPVGTDADSLASSLGSDIVKTRRETSRPLSSSFRAELSLEDTRLTFTPATVGYSRSKPALHPIFSGIKSLGSSIGTRCGVPFHGEDAGQEAEDQASLAGTSRSVISRASQGYHIRNGSRFSSTSSSSHHRRLITSPAGMMSNRTKLSSEGGSACTNGLKSRIERVVDIPTLDYKSMAKLELFLLASRAQSNYEGVVNQFEIERKGLLDALDECHELCGELRAQRDQLMREVEQMRKQQAKRREFDETETELREELRSAQDQVSQMKREMDQLGIEKARLEANSNVMANELKRAVVELRNTASNAHLNLGIMMGSNHDHHKRHSNKVSTNGKPNDGRGAARNDSHKDRNQFGGARSSARLRKTNKQAEAHENSEKLHNSTPSSVGSLQDIVFQSEPGKIQPLLHVETVEGEEASPDKPVEASLKQRHSRLSCMNPDLREAIDGKFPPLLGTTFMFDECEYFEEDDEDPRSSGSAEEFTRSEEIEKAKKPHDDEEDNLTVSPSSTVFEDFNRSGRLMSLIEDRRSTEDDENDGAPLGNGRRGPRTDCRSLIGLQLSEEDQMFLDDLDE